MIGINGILDNLKWFSPLREPSCDEKHHKRKKEAFLKAFDVDELVKILGDKDINMSPRERELFVATIFTVRRSQIRLYNQNYFDKINMLDPVYNRIRGLEEEITQLKIRLDKLEQGTQNE